MSLRSWAGAALLAAVSLISLFQLLAKVESFHFRQDGPDGITQFEQQIAALRAALAGEPAAGYIAGAAPPGGETAAQAGFHLIQYSLAPAIIVRGRSHRHVIGNFPGETPIGDLRRQGLVLVRDFGSGIVLFRNERIP